MRTIIFTLLLSAVQLAVSAGVAGDVSSAAGADGKWVVLNEDNDHYFKLDSSLMTREAAEAYVDRFSAGGKITHFFMCPNGQRPSYDSKAWEPIWAGMADPWDAKGSVSNVWCVNARLLHERGVDIYDVWTKRCRKNGVSPWITMRMNDVHWVNIPGYFRSTTFWKTRRDLWRYANPGREWMDAEFNYAKKEVRDWHLALFREMAERWDVDGVDLDWMRFPRHLTPGRAREESRFLTEVVREARRFLDALGAKRGRRIALSVRVPATPALAAAHGMDVADWVREGLVDVVVPSSFLYCDFRIPVAEWRRLTENRVRIVPNIDNCVMVDAETPKYPMEMKHYRGAADKYWREGADGIELFNLMYLETWPKAPEANKVPSLVFGEGLFPEDVAAAEKSVEGSYVDLPLEVPESYARTDGSILVFNEDDSHFLGHGAHEKSLKGIRAYADSVLRGGVTHFFVCPNAMRSSVDSKAYEPIWRAIDEPGVKAEPRCFAAKKLHDEGIDYVAEFLSCARRKGVVPGLSMRMNDVHFVTSSNFCGRSAFWRTHPELWRVPNTSHPWKWDEYAFDYAHKDVRDYQLAYVRELLGRYDTDFFECDWMRFPDHLTPGRERELADCLTAFMHDVRQAADAAAKRLGHPVRISVRVPSTPDNALGKGLDAIAWAKEGLVDWIVPCSFFHSVDFAIPYGEWTARIGAANPSVTVVPGADQNLNGVMGRAHAMTLEHYCGWADALFAQGAPGSYQFNFFAFTSRPTPLAELVLGNGLSPETIRDQPKRYAVTYHETAPDRKAQGFQLPAQLSRRCELTVITGKPPKEGRAEVWLGLACADPAASNLTVSVNGKNASRPVADPDVSRYGGWTPCRQVLRFEFPLSALRAVTNVVSVSSLDVASNLVVGCELRVDPRASADPFRRLSLEEYLDRMEGGWMGQICGVAYGAPTEFRRKGVLWEDAELPVWKPELVNTSFGQDDVYVEMTFLRTLERYGIDVDGRRAGIDFANSKYALWCANHAGRLNLRRGIAPPDSSHPAFNRCPNDIDYQIEADFSGLISPGLPRRVLRYGDVFGRLMNYGDGVYGGVFMGAMYAEAFFEADRVRVVEKALGAIPAGSQYAEMVRDVLSLYRKDPKRWQAAWRFLVDKYQNDPAYCRASNGVIDVKINGAMVLLGFLFGEGDVDATMRIATAGGYDSDCNPSSAAGVLGTMIGKSRLDEKYTKLFDRSRKFSFTSYDFNGLVRVCERLARQIVVAEGGSVERDGSGKECFLVPHQTVKPRSLELSWAPGPVASSRYTPHECAEIEDYRPMPDLAAFEDADPRRRVQKALDALAPGWTVGPVGNGEGKGRTGLYEGHCLEDYIVVVVPSNGTDSVSMTRRVTVGAEASLLVRAAADDQHRKDPWTLEVFVNGKRIGKQDLTGYYEDFSFPLPDSAGAVVDVEIRAIGACACFSRIRLDQGVQADGQLGH